MKRIIYSLLGCAALTGMVSCGYLLAKEDGSGAAFEYRDIYLPDYNKESNDALNLNTIDLDWGLWGHNLGSILPDYASKQVFARVNGVIKSDQFCFTSDKLYDYIVDYIKNRHMFDGSVKFAILPNDNEIVCMCVECRKQGNTKDNATPAVMYMIERLAEKFPKHQFFTSYYSTTKQLPDRKMPGNTGVLISAIDYPLSTVETKQEKDFIALIEQWKTKTDKVYVWDYILNYDDYFTPFPVFGIMQRRLKKYKDAGVTGVFLNGSGADYSTFPRLNKMVLAQLLQDPDQDWEELLRRYANEYYPTAGRDIAEFMIAQERMVSEHGKKLPMYDGVEMARKTYLPEREFVEFYNKLVKDKKESSGEERKYLETMTEAMALTMLELKRLNHDLENTQPLKDRLSRLIDKGTFIYNEGCWSIAKYLDNYTKMEQEAHATAESNLLKGVELHPRTPLDEDYQDITIVTDGQLGIPSNYHNGNLITSADPAFSVSVPRVPGMRKLKVWMVYNPGFKIGLPEEVYLTVDGVKLGSKVPEKPNMGAGHSWLEFDVPSGGDIILSLKKDPEIKTMAIDEIQAF